ncbi:MAG: GerAB/ArcD/ProY family transporter [Clostridia bacterium]|nr:GerAB/ArcD/ProY family transporter [Clostridia bacterium]
MNSSRASAPYLLHIGISLAAYRIFTNLPLSFTRFFGTGAPLFSLISGLLFFAILFFLTKRLLRTDSESIFYSSQKTFGSFGKYLIFILFFIYIFVSSAFLVSEFSGFSKLVAFPLSPKWFIAIFFVLSASIASLSTLQSLGKLFVLFIPLSFLIIAFFLITVFFESRTENLFPLLGTAEKFNLPSFLSTFLVFSDMLLIFILKPQNTKAVSKTILRSFILGFGLVFLLVITYTAKIPYPLSKDETFPLYLLVKEVYYGRFFQRIDAIVLLVSSIWGMLNLGLNFCLLVSLSQEMFGIKNRFAMVFPISASVFFAALFLSQALSHLSQFFLALSAGLLLLGLLILAIFLKKGGKPHNEN